MHSFGARDFEIGRWERVCRVSAICVGRAVSEEYTPADSAEFHDVAERAMALVEQAAMTTGIQAKVLHGVDLPARVC